MTDNAANERDAEPGRERVQADPGEFWIILRAAFSVLWLPITLFTGGFFLFYFLMWLWLG